MPYPINSFQYYIVDQISMISLDNILFDISEIGNSLRFLARRLSHFTYTIKH